MYRLLVAMLLLSQTSPAAAQVGVEVSLPGVSIGINLPIYPELVLLPGSPVYYAPRTNANYFFYDGLYWVYNDDNWYSSDWYNGPWQTVGPQSVPLFVLRIPVRYFRRPPAYFRGWRADAPPRWGERWGADWEGQHRGWNRWNRHDVPRAAPPPTYQKKYSGSHYPGAPEKQQAIRSQHYRYQPREAVARERFSQPAPDRRSPASREDRGLAPERSRPASEARPPMPDRMRDAGRPEPAARMAQPPARGKDAGHAFPNRPPAAPESRPSLGEADKQRPAAQPQPARRPEAGREPGRGPGQADRERDNNRNDERGPERRQ